MDQQQILGDSPSVPTNKHSNPQLPASSAITEQPASDWAQSTQSALGNTADLTESSTVPGETSHIVQPHETTGLDSTAKTQGHVDAMLGSHSTVSTPGVQVPGGWTEKPTTANQMLSDAGTTLAAVGSAAYNALPESVKGAFSSQTTNTSPIQTTTNHETITPSQNLSTTAQSTLSNVAETGRGAVEAAATGATLAYAQLSSAAQTAANTDVARSATTTASNAMNTVVDTLAGTHLTTAGIDKSKEIVSDRETASLPSQELFGARAMGGPRDGVGALPGHRDESGVAILPDDKEALANKAPDFAMESTTGPESLPATTEPTTSSTTWTESAKATAAGLTAAGYAAGATAQRVYEKPHEYIPGMKAPSNDTNAQTLPSEDVEGQLPSSGRMDGVGALPGHRDESGVAILPDDKAALANKPADTAVEPTNTNSTSWTESAKATAAGLTAAGYAAGATAQHVYEKPHEFIPGMRAGLNDGHTQPHHQTQTLPSEDVQGQLPLSGRMDGVGALPGGVNEEGVALLPEEKAHPNPLATSEIAAGKTNETLASPYNESSPYSNPEDNTIAQPSTAPGVSTKDKMEGKAEDLKNKVTPSKTTESTDTTTSEESTDSTGKKKVGFMSKLKGQSKIISGKLGGNSDKVEEGRAIKSGSNA